MSRYERQRAEADARMIDALEAAGEAGATTPEVNAALGLSSCTVSASKQRLTRLAEEGRIGYWLDPIGKCKNRRRWWHLDFLPASQPRPTNKRSAGLRDLKEQTHGLGWRWVQREGVTTCTPEREYRHQVLPGEAPSVVDSAQCRPWANSAAAQIGGAA